MSPKKNSAGQTAGRLIDTRSLGSQSVCTEPLRRLIIKVMATFQVDFRVARSERPSSLLRRLWSRRAPPFCSFLPVLGPLTRPARPQTPSSASIQLRPPVSPSIIVYSSSRASIGIWIILRSLTGDLFYL